MNKNTMIGLMISATAAMVPTSTRIRRPYPRRTDRPCSEMVVKISPMIPKGAQLMTHLTAVETASEILSSAFLVPSLAPLSAIPKIMAHARMPMKLALIRALTGLSTRFIRRLVMTSVTPLGGVTSLVSVLSEKVRTIGNSRLATTAQAAATTLPAI